MMLTNFDANPVDLQNNEEKQRNGETAKVI